MDTRGSKNPSTKNIFSGSSYLRSIFSEVKSMPKTTRGKYNFGTSSNVCTFFSMTVKNQINIFSQCIRASGMLLCQFDEHIFNTRLGNLPQNMALARFIIDSCIFKRKMSLIFKNIYNTINDYSTSARWIANEARMSEFPGSERSMGTRLPKRAFSYDVMAVILLFQNNKMAAMLVYQTNPVGGQLFSYVNVLFCSSKSAVCWPRELKRSIISQIQQGPKL